MLYDLPSNKLHLFTDAIADEWIFLQVKAINSHGCMHGLSRDVKVNSTLLFSWKELSFWLPHNENKKYVDKRYHIPLVVYG